MTRLVIAGVLGIAVVAVAQLITRRRWSPPTQSSWMAPRQLDRSDFIDHGKAWLVAVFSSLSCDACEKAIAAGAVLESSDVAYQNIVVENDPALHERYRIEQIPLILIADSEGVVQASYVGPPSAPEVWSEMAHLREHADR